MYSRVRDRQDVVPAQGRYYSTLLKRWTTVTVTGIAKKEHTEDVVGNRDGDNPFTSVSSGVSHVLINGVASNGNAWQNVPTQAGAYAAIAHLQDADMSNTEINQYAINVVAKTNVNAPKASLPTYFGELKDLPGLIRSFGMEHLRKIRQYRSGRAFAKATVERNLQYQWGIATMISDVKKMCDFANVVKKTEGWITRLHNGEAIRRNVVLDSDDEFSLAGNLLIYYSGGVAVNTGPRSIKETRKTWGSCQWVLDTSTTPYFPLDTQEQRREAAIRVYYGLTPHALGLTAWELCPWSWLADWFLHIQDVLDACQNVVPVTHSRMCVMRRTDTVEYAYPYTLTKGVSLTGVWNRWKTTKLRRPMANPIPYTVSLLPLLEVRKLSILGSLGILRRLPKWQAI